MQSIVATHLNHGPDVESDMTVLRSVLLQSLPGVPTVMMYLVLARTFLAYDIPNAFALFLSILFVEVPVSWMVMIRTVRKEGNGVSLRRLFPYSTRLSSWKLFGIGVPAAFLSIAAMFGLQTLIGEPIRVALFSWYPDWAVYAMTPDDMMALTAGSKIFLIVLVLVSGVIVGATTQELYARGFLLPRIAHIGPWSTVVSSGSFAVMHLASPWSWPVFAAVALIWSAMAYRWRSTALPVIAHVGMLALMWLGMLFTMFAQP